MIERRIVRSHEPKTAIYLYLVHLAQRLGLTGLALASGEGLLVTGTRTDERIDLDALAALGPAISGEEDVSPSFIQRALPSGSADATRVDVQGEAFYLAGIGGTLPRVGEVSETLARILA
jgi:hypothetical protein